MKKSKKLVFFGTEEFSVYALEALLNNGYNISAVVTKPDSPSGRGQKLKSPAVKKIARKHSIDIYQPKTLENLGSDLHKYNCEIAILSAYGKIIPKELLDQFSLGVINVHPSLLPLYRGPSPIEQAIINGDNETGVSLIKLVEKMDAGPILAQKKIPLAGDETAPELYKTLGKLGSALLIEQLPEILAGRSHPADQDDSLATYTPMINKSHSIIDWDKKATTIERQIRAYLGWPGSRTVLGDKDIIITKARLGYDSGRPGEIYAVEHEIGVYCEQGSIIIEKLKPSGKREMTSREFLVGNKLLR